MARGLCAVWALPRASLGAGHGMAVGSETSASRPPRRGLRSTVGVAGDKNPTRPDGRGLTGVGSWTERRIGRVAVGVVVAGTPAVDVPGRLGIAGIGHLGPASIEDIAVGETGRVVRRREERIDAEAALAAREGGAEAEWIVALVRVIRRSARRTGSGSTFPWEALLARFAALMALLDTERVGVAGARVLQLAGTSRSHSNTNEATGRKRSSPRGS